ncbi:MAG: hypothetical protein DRJ35_01515 [Thermoprotei archaeon]|nr:MAG: hypothetical protein DRJ35_01515 [Thermoprotei archaeon]
MRVYIEPPEETIIFCLDACVHWQSDLDYEKAAMVIVAQRRKIDWNYLEKRAEQERVKERSQEIKEVLEEK